MYPHFFMNSLPLSRIMTHSDSPLPRNGGFQIIELLVVIFIISLLMALLLPALERGRDRARMVSCASQERQMLAAVQAYAIDNQERLPSGPPEIFHGSLTWEEVPSHVLYIQALDAWNGGGLLLNPYLADGEVFFSPGDGSEIRGTELPKLSTTVPNSDVEGSYLFRNLAQVSVNNIDDLGRNEAGGTARALMIDRNFDFGSPRKVNHNTRGVHVGYLDGHAEGISNEGEWFSVRQSDAGNLDDNIARREQIFVTADHAEGGDNPATAPSLP